MLNALLLAPRGGEGSDDSAHGGDMSGCRSRRHWWRPLTTALRGVGGQVRTMPHGDRRPSPDRLAAVSKPQGSLPRGARTLSAPLLCVPRLDEGGMAVDSSALAFLEEKEEEEKRMDQLDDLILAGPTSVPRTGRHGVDGRSTLLC